jgi:putative nucleotidyltransferase with HDIG domain
LPGSPSHLIGRFFDVLSAKPLTAEERSAVGAWLSQAEARLFFSQQPADQRHAFYAASVVTANRDEDAVTRRAALLHDIGKRYSRLGVIGRSLVSLAIWLGVPLASRARLYRDHGELAASELAALGCEPLVVDFARHHHGERPQSIDPATWELLQLADQPPKAGHRARARIS